MSQNYTIHSIERLESNDINIENYRVFVTFHLSETLDACCANGIFVSITAGGGASAMLNELDIHLQNELNANSNNNVIPEDIASLAP